MVFNSVVFLFCFLPLSLLLYYLVPGRAKNAVLLAESLIFYCWTGVAFLPLIAVLIVFNYLWALLTARAKARLRGMLPLAAVLVNLGVLVYFKYANFLIDTVNQVAHLGLAALNIGTVLPLGISYYIFKIISYEVDVYTGKIAPEKNFITFAVYVLFFPQLIVGPIVKYREMADQLHDGANRCTPARAEHGAELFVFGLAKKVILADSIGALWTDIIGAGGVGLTNVSTPLAWLGIIAYSLQLYFDFAGYSEMSNGLAALLGFDCPANFNLPYISGSITEFWRRWHITLSGWFRDYIYIPLGGNRKGQARQLLNMFLVWAATGIWHGASWNFIAWGLYYFVLLTIEKNLPAEISQKGQGLAAYLYAVLCGAGLGHLYGQPARRAAGSAAAKAVCAPGRHFARVLPAQLRCAAGAGLCLLVRAAALAVGEIQQKYCGKAPCVCPADRAVRLLRSGRHERYCAVREFLRGGTDKCQRLCTVKTAAGAVRGIRCWCSAPCCCSGSPSSILCGPSARSSSWKTARPHSSRRSA